MNETKSSRCLSVVDAQCGRKVAQHGGISRNNAFVWIYERSEVLAVITIKTSTFWDMMQCSLLDRHQHLRGHCCLSLQGRRLSSKYIQIVSIYLQNYPSLYPRSQQKSLGSNELLNTADFAGNTSTEGSELSTIFRNNLDHFQCSNYNTCKPDHDKKKCIFLFLQEIV
jgi:hypothetical protein